MSGGEGEGRRRERREAEEELSGSAENLSQCRDDKRKSLTSASFLMAERRTFESDDWKSSMGFVPHLKRFFFTGNSEKLTFERAECAASRRTCTCCRPSASRA